MRASLPFSTLTVTGRSILVVPPMLIALWFVITMTLSATLSRTDTALAIRLDRGNSLALASAALVAAGDPAPQNARRAIVLAQRALTASPVSSDAVTALGIARAIVNPKADVKPIFQYSRSLGRRATLTEIWYIEHGARTGNVVEALTAYDHLFRVSDYYRAQFLPVLLGASAQPDVTRAMIPILTRRPAWRDEYFRGLVETFPGAMNFAMIVRVMHFDPRDPEGAKRLSLAMNRLVEANRPDLAYGVYRQAVGARRDPAWIRDGDFRRQGTLPPFDWDLTQGDELLAQIGTNDAGSPALILSNQSGRPGPLARQLLLLRPGDYRLTFMVGNVAGANVDRPQLRIACLSGAPTLSSTVFPQAPAAGLSASAAFRVPTQGCTAQWFVIQAGNPVDAIDTQPWINRIRISPSAVSKGGQASMGQRNGAVRWG